MPQRAWDIHVIRRGDEHVPDQHQRRGSDYGLVKGTKRQTTGFVRSRFPDNAWRVAGAVAAALLGGLNVLIVRFGSIAQAYGLCLLGIVSAYRLTVASVRHETARWAAGAGLLWGVALFSSLLTAPVGPVLLVWILANNRAGSRWRKGAAFLMGALIPSIPALLLFARGPSQVFFGAIQYNLVHRLADWPGATRQNLEVLASWINSGSALLLILLAACGLLFIRFRSRWDAAVKAEFYLCAWLSVAIAAYLFYVRPTFERYFVFAVPFVAILAVAGVYFLATTLYRQDRPLLPLTVLVFLLSVALGKSLDDKRDVLTWPELEKLADKVSQVTSPGQALYADEAIYFLTRHSPPSGMEMMDAHKFDFPPGGLRSLHLISQIELDRLVQARTFDTLETCETQEDIAQRGYAKLYSKSSYISDCFVFWDRRPVTDSSKK